MSWCEGGAHGTGWGGCMAPHFRQRASKLDELQPPRAHLNRKLGEVVARGVWRRRALAPEQHLAAVRHVGVERVIPMAVEQGALKASGALLQVATHLRPSNQRGCVLGEPRAGMPGARSCPTPPGALPHPPCLPRVLVKQKPRLLEPDARCESRGQLAHLHVQQPHNGEGEVRRRADRRRCLTCGPEPARSPS